RCALGSAALSAAAGLAQAQCSYQQLVAGDVQTNLFNGVAVAMDGDYILTGAEGRNTASGTRAGEVYAFSTFGTTYGQVAHILPATGAATDAYFGAAVALGGGAQWAVIGAPGAGSNAGLAYIFRRDLNTH